MNPLLRNGIYIVHISLGGLLLAYLLFDIKPSGLGMLGCLVAPLKWRAGNQEHREGVVLVWDGEVYGWKNELRDPDSERPGAYAVDKTGLIFRAEGGDDYNGAKAWVAVDPDAQ